MGELRLQTCGWGSDGEHGAHNRSRRQEWPRPGSLPADLSGELLATALVEGRTANQGGCDRAASVHADRGAIRETVPLRRHDSDGREDRGRGSSAVHVQSDSPIAHLVELGHREVHTIALWARSSPYRLCDRR